MTAREEIKELRDEVAELRKQLSAMAVAMAQLAAYRPVQYVQPIQYVPYVQPTPYVRPWQWQPQSWPLITYSSGAQSANQSTAKIEGMVQS